MVPPDTLEWQLSNWACRNVWHGGTVQYCSVMKWGASCFLSGSVQCPVPCAFEIEARSSPKASRSLRIPKLVITQQSVPFWSISLIYWRRPTEIRLEKCTSSFWVRQNCLKWNALGINALHTFSITAEQDYKFISSKHWRFRTSRESILVNFYWEGCHPRY